MLTRNSPLITRGISESALEKRIRTRNKIKVMQQQRMVEHIKENTFINQPTRTTIDNFSPALPINQKPHTIPDENGIWDVPNLDK